MDISRAVWTTCVVRGWKMNLPYTDHEYIYSPARALASDLCCRHRRRSIWVKISAIFPLLFFFFFFNKETLCIQREYVD